MGDGQFHSGQRYYTERMLFDRLIKPSGCELVGPYDFSVRPADGPGTETYGDAVFLMQKPIKEIADGGSD